MSTEDWRIIAENFKGARGDKLRIYENQIIGMKKEKET
jgi:hypothetical protein